MTTIAISCPKCEKQIKAPAELAGKKIRCKDCLHVFVVKAAAAAKAPAADKPAAKVDKPAKGAPDKAVKAAKEKEAAPAPAAPVDEDEEVGGKYDVTDQTFLPRCPYCAKELQSEEQVICLNCGYNRRTRERVHSKKTFETSGGDQFVWLLPGILCAVGVLSLIAAVVVIWVVFPDIESDHKEEWWSWFFGKAGRIYGTLLCGFIGFFLGAFAVRRLIMNPHAPEVEKYK
jgi:hypothetical protein